MSRPPATIRTTLPASSSTGALRQAITRRSPRAFVKVFSYSAAGWSRRGGVEALDHRLALGLVDEDVPEEAAAHLVRRSSYPVAIDGRRVEVRITPLVVDADEQARRRVDDRVQEVVLRAELGLEALVVERERDRGRDARDELRLVEQRLVVHERADRPAVALDERRGAARARARATRRRVRRDRRSGRPPRAGRRARASGRRAPPRSRRAAAPPGRSRRRAAPTDTAREPAAQDAEQERERDGCEEARGRRA